MGLLLQFADFQSATLAESSALKGFVAARRSPLNFSLPTPQGGPHVLWISDTKRQALDFRGRSQYLSARIVVRYWGVA